ncbi:MAG: xanthine dehydrogenase family protein subunit M [Vicinamibacterales bacterium]
MHTQRFVAPLTVVEALRFIETEPGAAILAGGTDLLVQYQGGIRRPTAFVDVKRIPELMRIAADADGVTIGAGVPAADIAAHPAVRTWWPGLVEAVCLIGSTQIQSRGSLGGNLCNASPAADSTCSLIVNKAVAIVAGSNGERQVPVEHFATAPGKTLLQPGELLVAIRLPKPVAHTADAYQRLIPRSEMDIAVASAAVSVTLDASGVCTSARVAIGAVAPTALLVPDAADALVGSVLGAAALSTAAAAASAAARPIDDKRGPAAYRRTVVGVLTKRVAAIAAARAKEQ